MGKDIDLLEKITPKLPVIWTLGELVEREKSNLRFYRTDRGMSYSTGIYFDTNIAIAKTLIPEGHLFKTHLHNKSYEMLIVLEGSLEVRYGDHKVILNQHDFLRISKGEPHSALAKKDTEIIVLTVPSDEGFPRAKT